MARDLYMSAPRQYPGVMVSSTFADLREHRAALMSAIQGQQLHAVAMESDSALPAGTVLDSSLRKVREAAGYVGIISHRYGQIPVCDANPEGLSLTHLEYREAVRLGRPILIFIMGAEHPITLADVEDDPVKKAKLAEFREEVKLADGELHRVYRVFTSLEDFTTGATRSTAELRRLLESEPAPVATSAPDGVPAAPELYACPRYLGSHAFVGRREQLTTLSEWASAAESRPVLLFEAIGGTGKSILTWEWINHYAPGVRDWAGRFWYSFYEAGAVMADFCQQALAYMTGRPLAEFAGKGQSELGELLLRQLESKPWLMVLDGLERILVAYHRYDAARLLDEDAGVTDEIGHRHPCAATRPEDEELLRRLVAATPSKILISSRLVPRVLLNHASQAIPGVLHQQLPGLRPADAEALLRACGVTGDSRAMRTYLKRNCDCHPLVTGIVAGLVNNYVPARGDFDEWAADAHAGGSLDVGELNLVQKRNHILDAALAALPEPSRRLLSSLAFLSEAVDYETLRAVGPRMPVAELSLAVSQLEQRGLLQYDWITKHYDLHPVVRAVSAKHLRPTDLRILGQRVVDHFSADAHRTYPKLSSVDELRGHITVVRTLLQMGKMRAAYGAYHNGLNTALLYQLGVAAEALSLIRPFFGRDWAERAPGAEELRLGQFADLTGDAAVALDLLGDHDLALELFQTVARTRLDSRTWGLGAGTLRNVSIVLHRQNRLGRGQHVAELGLQLAEVVDDARPLYFAGLQLFESLVVLGRITEAEDVWSEIDLSRAWDEDKHDMGAAELAHAEFKFEQGADVAQELGEIEAQGRWCMRGVIRGVHRLRGRIHLKRAEWAAAAAEFEAVVSLARQSGIPCADDEARHLLARLRLGQLPDPRAEIERLSANPFLLAQLWQVVGDQEHVVEHALLAYEYAWADGEPYVRRFVLNEVNQLLEELGVPVPELPAYDPAKDEPLPCERLVEDALVTLRKKRSR